MHGIPRAVKLRETFQARPGLPVLNKSQPSQKKTVPFPEPSSSTVRTSGKRSPPMDSKSSDAKRQKASRSSLSLEMKERKLAFQLLADTSKYTLENQLKLDELEKRYSQAQTDATMPVRILWKLVKEKLRIDDSTEVEILCHVSFSHEHVFLCVAVVVVVVFIYS